MVSPKIQFIPTNQLVNGWIWSDTFVVWISGLVLVKNICFLCTDTEYDTSTLDAFCCHLCASCNIWYVWSYVFAICLIFLSLMFSFPFSLIWKTNVSMLTLVLIFGHLIPSAAMVRAEIQDETDRVTGKTKQISPIPIHLSIHSPNGRLFVTIHRLY